MQTCEALDFCRLHKNKNCAFPLRFSIENLKGNAQFLFLCNRQKSRASQVCIDFPQITKKKTEDIIHWLEPINET